MASYTNALIVYTSGKLQKVAAGDDLVFEGSLSGLTSLATTGNLTVGGNLNVAGAIVSHGVENLAVSDPYIGLAANKTDQTAASGGFHLTLKAATGFTPVATASFVAGVIGTSAPTVTVESGAGASFSAGDIIQISGTTDDVNIGLYAVESVASDTLTVYGIGGTPVPSYAEFIDNQFTTATDTEGTIVKVDLAIIAISAGNLYNENGDPWAAGTPCTAYYESATLEDFNNGWTIIGGGLQEAYNVGNSIVLTDARDLTVSKPVTGTAAISLEANANSSFTVDAANLTLQTTTSGDVSVTSAGSISATAATNASLTATSGTVIVESSAGAVQIDAVGAASYFAVDGASLSLQTTTSGALAVASAGTLDIDAVDALSINSSAGVINIGDDAVNQNINIGTAGTRDISLGSVTANDILVTANGDWVASTGSLAFAVATNSNISLSGNDAGDVELALQASNMGAGNGIISTASDVFSVLATSNFTIDGSAASYISVAGADLTLSTTGSGNLAVSSAGLADIDAASALSLNSSGGVINIGDDAVAQNINIGTGGARVIAIGSVGAGDISLTTATDWTASADSLAFAVSANSSISLSGNDVSDVQLDFSASNLGTGNGVIQNTSDAFVVDTLGGDGASLTVAENTLFANSTVVLGSTDGTVHGKAGQLLPIGTDMTTAVEAGEVVYLNSGSGLFEKADNVTNNEVFGVSQTTAGASATNGVVVTVPGSFLLGQFDVGTATTPGAPVFLSANAGKMTQVVPLTGRVYRLGILVSDTAVGGLYRVMYLPQFIADI